jgi:hypothetical protein
MKKKIPFFLLLLALAGMSNANNPDYTGYYITLKDARAQAQRSYDMSRNFSDPYTRGLFEGYSMAFAYMADQAEAANNPE